MGELERDARWCNAVHNNPQLIVGKIILATHSISPFVLMGGWSGLIYDCFHSLGIEIVMRVEAPTSFFTLTAVALTLRMSYHIIYG